MIAAPKWKGSKPAGIKQIFKAEPTSWDPDADRAARPR